MATKKKAATLAPPNKVADVESWVEAYATRKGALAQAPGRGHRSAVAAACVRALALIGGDEALEVIASYAGSKGRFGGSFADAVGAEVIAAWDVFDRARFAQRMFGDSLDLEHSGRVDRLDGLEALKGLTTLRISPTAGCSLQPLTRCGKLALVRLNLPPDGVDLEPLARVAGLQHLSLINSHGMASLEALGKCQQIRELYVSIGAQATFDFLDGMRGLVRLKLAAERDDPSPRELEVLGALLARGVRLRIYESGWIRNLPWPMVRDGGYGTLGVPPGESFGGLF